jgi:hypothetical protein
LLISMDREMARKDTMFAKRREQMTHDAEAIVSARVAAS